MALSWVYALYGRVGIVSGLFFGLKAAVLAIVLQAVVRIGSKALKNRVMLALAESAFVMIYLFAVPFPVIVFGAGPQPRLASRRPLPHPVGSAD